MFAKDSDRPPDEVQIVESFGPREPGGTLRTQYVEMPDTGAFAVVGSRPTWLWGFEHGVNEHRVAIGNEAVYTTVRATTDPGLIGMDLVRLGLERGRTACDAVDVITSLLEEHGQSGACHQDGGTYHSSFLICDPTEIWVVETAGTKWAAERSASTAAISNRISLASFEECRDPDVATGFADVRLQASRACLARGASSLTPADLMVHLRDHGSGGDERMPAKDEFSVCMHIVGAMNTTSAMVCELPQDPAEPIRAWCALGNPCVSVFVPFRPFVEDVPEMLSDEQVWRGFASLRDQVETDPSTFPSVSAAMRALERQFVSSTSVAAR